MTDPDQTDTRAAHRAARVSSQLKELPCMTALRPALALVVMTAVAGCAPSTAGSPSPSASESAEPSAGTSAVAPPAGSLVIAGRIVTMDQPPVVEAILMQDGMLAAIGTRDEMLAVADDAVPVIDLGDNVAYPGFIDAHAHWIGDRDYYHLGSAAEPTAGTPEMRARPDPIHANYATRAPIRAPLCGWVTAIRQ